MLHTQAKLNLQGAREDQVPAIVRGLVGSIAAILQQPRNAASKGSVTNPSRETQSVSQSDYKHLIGKITDEIKLKVEGQEDILKGALKTAHEAKERQTAAVRTFESQAIQKWLKHSKKQLHTEYVAAIESAEKASEAQEALLSDLAVSTPAGGGKKGRRKSIKKDGLQANVAAFLSGEFASIGDFKGVEDIGNEEKKVVNSLEAAAQSRERIQEEKQKLRLALLQTETEAAIKLSSELSRLVVRQGIHLSGIIRFAGS